MYRSLSSLFPTRLLLMAVGALYLLAPLPVQADPPEFNPDSMILYLDGDPCRSMTVLWIGEPADQTARTVWLEEAEAEEHDDENGEEHEHETIQVVAEVKPFPFSDRFYSRAQFTDLEPGTEYRFRIVGADQTEYRFRTLPDKLTEPLHYVSGGDVGVTPEAVAGMKNAAAQDPAFAIIGGDIAYANGENPTPWVLLFRDWHKHMRDSEGRMIPLLTCIGNHEINKAVYRSGDFEPGEDAPFFYRLFSGRYKPGHAYSVMDVGDYLSIVLADSDHSTPLVGEQTEWFDRVLAERQDKPHLFVYYHVPAWPSQRGVDDETGVLVREHWVPLMEKHGVDAVFEHHDHTYKRTKPILNGEVHPEGLVYIGDGAWGRTRTPNPQGKWFLENSSDQSHIILTRLDGDQRSHVVISASGKVLDVYPTTGRRLPAEEIEAGTEELIAN